MEILDIVALISAIVTIIARLVYILSQYQSNKGHNKKVTARSSLVTF